MLLAPSSQEEADVVKGDEDSTEPSQPASPAYGKLLDVMAHATVRLDLAWGGREKREIARGRPDERFLSGHNSPSHHEPSVSSSTEMEKLWKKPFSDAFIHSIMRIMQLWRV